MEDKPLPVKPLIEARNLSQRYTQRQAVTGKTLRIPALDCVDLSIAPGASLALVGQSGSGKSTLARCLMRLEEPSEGEIWFEGRNLLAMSRAELFAVRRRMQLILQDPASGFNPRLDAAEIVAEPLLIQGLGTRQARREKALHFIQKAGLLPEWAGKLPLELSGGQRQRLAIARALVMEPEFLIFDEALSGLDLSIQAQIVNLLIELRAAHSLTYLFITHDLALAGVLAEEIAVMHEGHIVERARTPELFTNARHPASQALLASMTVAQTGVASRTK